MIVFDRAEDAIDEAQFCAESECKPFVIVFHENKFGVCLYDDVTDLSLIIERFAGPQS